MGESTAGNGRWKRGEQYGRDRTASMLFGLESSWRTVLARVYSIVCGWKLYGEYGRIVNFSALIEYVRGLETNNNS
jgi:hypothetical protein